MSERKKGAILSYIQVVLSAIVSVIYVPILLRYLGKSEYGLYQIVGSFFRIYRFLNRVCQRAC